MHPKLKQILKKEKRLSVARYMELCLYHPDFGYYTTGEPFKDFATAPELTPIFGEMLGLWVADLWEKLERPTELRLIECGPGRGTLMADLLRAIRHVRPACAEALSVTLVETSPKLRSVQQLTLAAQPVTWTDDFFSLKPAKSPVIILGNEFLDAFPIRQYERAGTAFKERQIKLSGDTLEWVESKETFEFDPRVPFIEQSQAIDWLMRLATWLEGQTAAGLMIDYGYIKGFADTLQAMKNGQKVPVLSSPAEADLTAHVNFDEASKALGPLAHPIIELAEFLTVLGMPSRATQVIKATQSQKQQDKLVDAMERLLNPSSMGGLHKVLAFSTENIPTPAALLPRDTHAAGG